MRRKPYNFVDELGLEERNMKLGIKIVKYKLPVRFVREVMELAEDLGFREVGIVSARTRGTNVPITKFNFYGNCSEETVKKVEKKLIELFNDFGMSVTALKKVQCEQEKENEQKEHQNELSSVA